MSSPYKDSLVEYEQTPTAIPLSDYSQQHGLAKKTPPMPNIEAKPDRAVLLKAIFPPREWEQDGKHFIQYASPNMASREDVTKLQTNLDQRLLSRQARESGICPIREELHSQCFDEIIRQVAIECPERGILLTRVRDELKTTIGAYQTLYKSAVAFGMNKQNQAKKGISELENNIKDLESKKKELVSKKYELDNKRKAFESKIAERKEKDKLKRIEESKFLEQQFDNMKKFMNTLNAGTMDKN